MLTSPFYPQNNGKLDRFHKSYKSECVRPKIPLSMDDAKRETDKYIKHYNNERLHAAIRYIAPADKLEERDKMIFDDRNRKLAEARKRRKEKHVDQACDEQNKPNDMKQLDILSKKEESPGAG
ncbi:MAG: transposase [Magnetococcales bacterium]|nr:transposase [Magnetococcales bacterium]